MRSNEKQFTKGQLIGYLVEFSINNNTINISKKDIDENKLYPSSATFSRYFGSWRKAIQEAGLETGVITGRPQDPSILLNEHALEIINGELLGDGCLSLSGSYKSNACFQHSTANINYGEYLYDKLNKESVPLLNKEFLSARNGKPQFRTRSTTNQFWTELHNKWYNMGIKAVPDDIKLTKETCLHWYLGDGYFEHKTSKFSTCGFNKDECKMLSKMLTDIGFVANINKRSGGYYVIRFSKYSYQDFLEWIGPCPVKGYEHRWGTNDASM